jgi:integrase
MPRRVVDRNLDSREARSKLKVRGKPYYRAAAKGAHLGYRRLKSQNGSWLLRRYVGDQKYEFVPIAAADDLDSSDGINVLTFWEAVDKAKELADAPTEVRAGPYTVRIAVEDYLKHLTVEKGPKAAADAHTRLMPFVLPVFGDLELRDLTDEALQDWRNKLVQAAPRLRTREGEPQKYRKIDQEDANALRKRKVSVNKVTTAFRAALNYARKRKKIHSDEAWRDLTKFKKVDVSRARYLKIAEAKRLINACDPEFKPLVQAALTTGCRYSELCQLTVGNFDRDAGTVEIAQSKSGKPRQVELNDDGRKLFVALIAGRAGSDLIFRRDDGTPWRKSHQCRRMVDACKNAKISPPVSFHILRHTWASLSAMADMPLMVLAKNLGHRDTAMVEKFYGHLAPSYVKKAIREHAPTFDFQIDTKVKAIR